MRRWSLLGSFCLLYALLLAGAQEEEIVSKRVYLKTPASFVNLTAETWKITPETEQVLIAVRFKAQSAVGRVLSSKFLKQDGSIEAELEISLKSGQLQVDLLNSRRENILIKPLTNIYMNETSEHSVAVKINALSKTLSYSVEQRAEHSAEINADIQWIGAEILTELGGGGQSVIGCVSLITVQVNDGSESPLAHVITLSENEVEKCQTESECVQRNCGKGRCLALEVPTCDCFTTGKTGPNCASEPKTVELNNIFEQSPDTIQSAINFKPWKEDQRISRIAMDFKFKATEPEGVFMYGTLEGGGFLKMFAVGSLGTLLIADNKLNFTLGNTNEFHNIGLLFADEQLRLVVDNVVQTFDLPSLPLFTSLTFGSSPPNDGVSESGLTACLKNLYIDHWELLDLFANKDSRVTTTKVLKSCSDPNEAVILPGQKTFLADSDFDPLPEEDDNSDEFDENQISHGGVFGPIQYEKGKNKLKDSMPCEKAQEYLCRNGATCLRGSSKPFCICAPGYGGAFCQFSLFPRSCAEAFQFYRLPEGPTRLDVDSSNDQTMSVADCRSGVTTIPHDMPKSTTIRAAEDPKHGLFVLSYMDFTPTKLEALISHSGTCRQQINYKCNHAPLHFSDNRTWFRVASKNQSLSQMGALPNGCQCIDIGCVNQGRCNCDAGTIGTDEGVLQGKQAGITSIVALHREGDVSGEMSISSLECSGFVSENNAIRFQRPGSYLLEEWNGGSLTLHFRTGDPSGTLLYVMSRETRVLQIELLDGHTMKAVTGEGELVIESQAKLNDTKWHLLVIEWISEELRVSIDSSTNFRELKASPFGNVTLGDVNRGIIGCFRSILLGLKTVEMKGSIDGITFGRCEDNCLQKTCHNGAECRENFATGIAECSCKYPRLHSGADCSHDINSDSSVSFHGGFIKYEDLANPLTDSWLLSFRTDQPSALLLYAHDEKNNFLQLHVRDEVNVTISLNNGGVVYSCTVQAPPGMEYSDMRWVQIYIDHSSTGTTLTVEEEACTIRAARLLANEPLKEYSRWTKDLTMPPVGLDEVHKKFVYVFLGGVQRADQEEENLKLTATYESRVEDLLGCMRGVKLGNKVLDLRSKAKVLEDKGLVQIGCNVKCDTLACHNGGHCSVAWTDFNPASVKTTCDCSRTSYAGPHCLEDVGVTFNPPQSINFDLGSVLDRYLKSDNAPPQSLKFAFNAEPTAFRQMLAILYFDDSSEFEILLNKNGSLHIGIIYSDGRATAMTFKGNFTDGYRHFLVAQFASNVATRVYVDGVRKDFIHMGMDNLDLYSGKRLWLGGQKALPGLESGIPAKKNLQGCISNVNLDLGVNVLNFWPISYLNSESSYSNLTLLQPLGSISKGQCAAFKNPNQPIAQVNTVSPPAWETNFRKQEYHLEVAEDEKESGGTSWLLIILGIILILVLIALIIFFVCRCRKGDKDNLKQNISLDEREPLRQTQFPQTPPIGHRQPHSNYAVPQPDIQLPSPRAEDLSDLEDFDRTITPGSQVTIFEDEISRPTSAGFDRSSPQRLSSFRDNSVPIGSPLYSHEMNRRPRPTVIPTAPKPPTPPKPPAPPRMSPV